MDSVAADSWLRMQPPESDPANAGAVIRRAQKRRDEMRSIVGIAIHEILANPSAGLRIRQAQTLSNQKRQHVGGKLHDGLLKRYTTDKFSIELLDLHHLQQADSFRQFALQFVHLIY